MISRRANLLFLLFSSLGLFSPSALSQQRRSDLDEILSGSFLEESDSPDQIRKYSALYWMFIDLRSLYNWPNGYEANKEWLDGAKGAWQSVYGEPLNNYDKDFQMLRRSVDGFLQSHRSRNIISEARNNLDRNINSFDAWMGNIGIPPNSRLYNDIIKTQAAMTIFYSAKNDDIVSLDWFDKRTWIWPFCKFR